MACLVVMAFTTQQAAKPKLVLIGDSTVKNGSGDGRNGQWGWGDRLAPYFDTARIEVINRARGGRSSRTFITEGLWKETLDILKPGDYLMIQFGHNDGGSLSKDRARGSLRGLGCESQTVLMEATGKPETVYSFGANLRRYVREAKAMGVTPILVSLVPRNMFKDDKVARADSSYGGWARQIAQEEGVDFIDLNNLVANKLEKIGKPVVDSSFFKGDHTHTSWMGANLNALTVVESLQQLQGCELKQFLLNRTYVFGNSPQTKGIPVMSSSLYAKGQCFGFDLVPPPADAKGACVGGKGFFFSIDLPEGDYDVTLELGNPDKPAVTTVRAESRRLLLEKVKTKKGEFSEQSFTVNIRNKRISADREVRIKPREMNKLNWDSKLTIELSGENPGLRSLRIAKAEQPLTVFLCGNSTVVDQDNEPWCGWGQMIPRFFGKGISFANYAESGEAANSFIAARRLEKLFTQAKVGDYIFVEFGHNDEKQKGEGKGPWLSYTQSLREFVAESRKRGLKPVLVTPMHRRRFDSNGKVENTHGEYPDAVRKLAADENVPLIDLTKLSETLYEAWGPQNSTRAFVHYPANTFPGQTKALEDNTHFNAYGGYEIAKCMVEGMRQNGLTEILRFLRPDYKPFDPARPDDVGQFSLPLSPFTEVEKPDGN